MANRYCGQLPNPLFGLLKPCSQVTTKGDDFGGIQHYHLTYYLIDHLDYNFLKANPLRVINRFTLYIIGSCNILNTLLKASQVFLK